MDRPNLLIGRRWGANLYTPAKFTHPFIHTMRGTGRSANILTGLESHRLPSVLSANGPVLVILPTVAVLAVLNRAKIRVQHQRDQGLLF